jgi:two-component system sensor histidine kinase ChvG
MTLKRQLLLVSLLTLMLPWAGCEFIRETESALRSNQQQMLAGTARAMANSMSQYADEFPPQPGASHTIGEQLYGHPLETNLSVDGYFDDWQLDDVSLRRMQGKDGEILFAIGLSGQFVYLYVAVRDDNVVYADAASLNPIQTTVHADRVQLISVNPPYLNESFSFAAEAPGSVVAYLQNAFPTPVPKPTIQAHWEDAPRGYQLEARIPRSLLGTHLGVVVTNTSDTTTAGVRSASFSTATPGAFVTASPELTERADSLVQQGMRLTVTDRSGWRIATVGDTDVPQGDETAAASAWLQVAYGALVERGTESVFSEPDPSGREQQPYVATALGGQQAAAWFRSNDSGRAIVAVAQPIIEDGEIVGALILQQSTDAILSLRNAGLARLMNVTMIAMFVVAAVLLGYASLLSRRVRRLSVAAEQALERDSLHTTLPSSDSADEIGDLSRSFGYVLGQLGDYNEYLRTLASKLSHELRTPLAIVTSSLENLEHENLNEASVGYTARAKDGADRLRKILAAMSEASRVEELMKSAEPETFNLREIVESTVAAYQDIYKDHHIVFESDGDELPTTGSPELLIQMLDKLVDNAVSFSSSGDEIGISLSSDADESRMDVTNPGPPLPDRMRSQLFDSMVSMRPHKDNKHLGLGLYVAKLIADGHNGRIDAKNIDGGVRFSVWLPATAAVL